MNYLLSQLKEQYGVEIKKGVQEFHPQLNMNFQLNRFHHFGFITSEDIRKATPKIKTLKDWSREFLELAKKAEAEGRLLNAAFLYRTAEFYTYSNDPINDFLYDKFINLFYKVFKKDDIEIIQVPYENSYLHTLHIIPQQQQTKGTVIIHGGGDSFIEAFIVAGKYISYAGYDVIMFDGPGQGTTLHRYKLKMTYEWEKPTKAVLDYFNTRNVTLVGVSLGGYLAPRAAAYDDRISRVVMFDLIGDFYGSFISILKFPLNFIVNFSMSVKAKRVINKVFNKIARKSTLTGQFFEWWLMQACFMWGVETPYEVFKYMKNFNALIISKYIKQDVLVLAGEDDLYTQYFHEQMKVLTNAKSVEGRIFTKEEQGHLHCQVGNIELALEYILEWINRKEGEHENSESI